jgi:pimeloyl-ACP methyl ester carboxylesterase
VPHDRDESIAAGARAHVNGRASDAAREAAARALPQPAPRRRLRRLLGRHAGGGRRPELPPGVSERTAELDATLVFWRSAPVPGEDAAVPLYIHGVPTNSDDWLPFLARSGGIAVDLPGFGRSGKAGDLRCTIPEYGRFLERFLDLAEIERVALVVHDWGAVGLAFAQAHPDRIEKLVLIDAVPFLPGYHWHRVARIWRTPVLGELAMGFTGPLVLRRLSRAANVAPGPMPPAWQRSVLEHFDQGTQRAILRLYRSAPPDVLARAGGALCALDVPVLVAWGARDPYLPVRFAHAYAGAFARPAELVILDDAGHWPWLDRPDLIDRVTAFLARA